MGFGVLMRGPSDLYWSVGFRRNASQINQVLRKLAMKKFEKTSLLWLVAGYFGWGSIAMLSLLPAANMPHTGVGATHEHWLAYAAVGFSFGSGYLSLRSQLISALAMTLTAMVFELLQNFVPGRDPDISDFVAGSLGAWVGLALATLAQALFKAARN